MQPLCEFSTYSAQLPFVYTSEGICPYDSSARAIDILFEKIKEFKKEANEERQYIGSLFREMINRKRMKVLEKNIDDLIRSDDKELKKLGKWFDGFICYRGT